MEAMAHRNRSYNDEVPFSKIANSRSYVQWGNMIGTFPLVNWGFINAGLACLTYWEPGVAFLGSGQLEFSSNVDFGNYM